MKSIFFLLIILPLSVAAQVNEVNSLYDLLLKKYVSNDGEVSYSNLKKDEKKLDQYLLWLAKNEPNNSVSKNEKLAYWINAYNAFTLKLIIRNFPVNSITELDNGKPWDTKWIKIGNKTYSLNNIEHDVIRKNFKEPRIHFALNCAARSCPPLRNKAYTAKNLDVELDEQTKRFINNDSFNIINKKQLKVSKLFDWYSKDFVDVQVFLKKYKSSDTSAKLTFKEYDWSLNGK